MTGLFYQRCNYDSLCREAKGFKMNEIKNTNKEEMRQAILEAMAIEKELLVELGLILAETETKDQMVELV